MSLESLRNWMRCTFCKRRSYCGVRYRVGDRHYYSGFGFISVGCPKVLEREVPYYGMSVRQIQEMFRKQVKKEKD